MELVVPKEYTLQSFDKQCVFRFDDGIPGFENAREWIILCNQAEEPFAWMQSISVPDLSFIVVDPWQILPEYSVKISDYDINRLGVTRKEDVLVLVIVSVKEKIEEMTANLIGPVVLNVKEKKGAQVVIQNCMDYSANHAILAGVEQAQHDRCANKD